MPDLAQQGAVLVVGAGPGVGLSVARRFGGSQTPIGLVARNPGRLDRLRQQLSTTERVVVTAAANAADPDQLRQAIEAVVERTGVVGTLCFSPLPPVSSIRPVRETTAADLNESLALTVGGAASAVGAVLAGMLERGAGRLLFVTGSAAAHPSAERAASAAYGAAQTAYLDVLRSSVSGTGVSVVHLAVAGAIGEGGRSPDDVAQTLWALAESGSARALLDR